jgi:hypothetical protein
MTEPQRLSDPKFLLALLITSRHGLSKKHRSSLAVQLLLRDGITCFVFVRAANRTDCAENIIPLLLLRDRCLVTAGCCDPKILVFNEYATILLPLSLMLLRTAKVHLPYEVGYHVKET